MRNRQPVEKFRGLLLLLGIAAGFTGVTFRAMMKPARADTSPAPGAVPAAPEKPEEGTTSRDNGTDAREVVAKGGHVALQPTRGFKTFLLGLAGLRAGARGYPSQTITIVVPVTPGAGPDTVARAVAPKLNERLGQAVVVENKPGASGNIGADAVAKAKPDGYTVLMSTNSMLMAAQLYKKVPFDPIMDFSPVSMAAFGTLMLVVNPKIGIKSMGELIAQARAKPGVITYGSPGIGTPHHMAMELFNKQARLSMLHVPFRGSSGYTQDLLSGEVMVGFLPVHVAASFVNAGRLTALAVGSSKRHPLVPGVPTIEELGEKGVDVDMWFAFFVPSKTPAPVVTRLHSEISAILESPEVREVLAKAGLEAASSTPDELSALVRKDYSRWGNIIKRNNIAVE